MLYPIAIEKGDSSFGVQVPDVPGCFSGGETIQEAMESAKEAIYAHLELLLEDNEELPLATSVENYLDDPDFQGLTWALVDIDVTQLLGKAEKINVTLPSLLIRKIDLHVANHQQDYGSRSGFLAKVAAERVLQRKRP